MYLPNEFPTVIFSGHFYISQLQLHELCFSYSVEPHAVNSNMWRILVG